MPNRPSIATFIYPSHTRNSLNPDTVYGAGSAASGFLDAIVSNLELGRLHIFADTGSCESRIEHIERIQARTGAKNPRVFVRDFRNFKQEFRKLDLSAWLDFSGAGKIPFHVRETFAPRPFPITFLHHSISYGCTIEIWYRRLLSYRIFEFDSLICTSRAAQAAISKTFEILADRMRSRWQADFRFKGRFDVIPLGVDTHFFRPRDPEVFRDQLDIPRDTLVLLWFGRLSVADKADLLPMLGVFRELIRANPKKKLLLLIAGSERVPGVDRAVLERHAQSLGIAKQVRVQVTLPGQPAYLYYCAADIFLSPSDNLQEAFGITPVEALACGIPQVVSDWDGYRDTVVDGETGFLVPTLWSKCDRDIAEVMFAAENDSTYDMFLTSQSVALDTDAWLVALQKLVSSPELRKRMGEASRKRALASYDWAVVVGRYVKLWEELSMLARRYRGKPMNRIPIDQAIYSDAYSGYPTHFLKGSERLQITQSGKGIVRGKEELPNFYGPLTGLDSELLVDALQALAKGRQTVTLRDLSRLVKRQGKLFEDAATRHVMWLLKYGYLRILKP